MRAFLCCVDFTATISEFNGIAGQSNKLTDDSVAALRYFRGCLVALLDSGLVLLHFVLLEDSKQYATQSGFTQSIGRDGKWLTHGSIRKLSALEAICQTGS